MSFPLDGFELVERIGHGGMAEVWRGSHAHSGAEVAIKLVTASSARTRTLREAIQNEVRAMARLEHPGIVLVLDYGLVPEQTEQATQGAIARGSPYLVMELCDGGKLKKNAVGSWQELRALLTELLRALAHAHARGVIHRDLKPSNVLTHRGGYKLADFGIASALGRGVVERSVPLSAGTAFFMAPEQVLGLHRDEGPWTDLYSLGCLTYLLASNKLPFRGERDDVYRAHVLSEPARLSAAFAVPAELETWTSVLMAKRPEDRFELAADALAVLERMGPPSAPPAPPAESAQWPLSESSIEGSTRLDPGRAEMPTEAAPAGGDAPTVTSASIRPPPLVLAAAAAVRREAAPMPAAFLELPRTDQKLLGVGLGVYGLRSIPLAGRGRDRRALWEDLHRAAGEARPRAIVLRGRTGLGKTRLCEWLAEQALETGAASVVWSSHGTTPGPTDGVTTALVRTLRLDGLSNEEADARIDAAAGGALRRDERIQLATLLAPRARGRDLLGSLRPSERFAMLRRLLAAMSRRRPVLLVVDDAHHGVESIALVDHLLRAPGMLRLLAVLTAREEALEERHEEAEALAALGCRAGVRTLEIGPLPEAAHASMVAELLGLEPGLAGEVAERTGGSPLFAVQLVGDWVQRGLLIAGTSGFELAPGASPTIPDDIHALWRERVTRLIEAIPAASRADAAQVLELAATLGRSVVLAEWEQACAEASARVPEGLLDALAQRRLAHVGRRRMTFVHAMLLESLERLAREGGREARLHLACARMLRSRYGADDAQAERLGRHLLLGGEVEAAHDPLLRGAKARLRSCEFDVVHELLDLAQTALERSRIGDDDRRHAELALARADAFQVQGQLEEAARAVERAEVCARASGDEALLAHALRLRGGVTLKRGQLEPTLALASEARVLLARHGEEEGVGLCDHAEGEALKLLGRFEEAEAAYGRAISRFRKIGSALGAARSEVGLADLMRRVGRTDEATALLEQTVATLRALGNRHSEAVALNGLGDLARGRGDTLAAESWYAESMGVFDEIASEEAAIVRMNLALLLLGRGEHAQAWSTLEEARPVLEQEGREGYLLFAIAGMAAARAGLGDRDLYRDAAAERDAMLHKVPMVDDDLTLFLRMAGEECARRGWIDEARAALSRAADQYREIGRHELEQQMRERLAELG